MELFIYEFSANSSLPADLDPTGVFFIRTCQRSLILSITEISGIQYQRSFFGANAYEFLLRFASGLESEIKGETDVFGQVKCAFKNFIEENPVLAGPFQNIFQALLEDTKEIRAQYLRGIGGNSYGTLARRALSPTSESNVLILGAGQISKSVSPFFADFNLTIFNRSEDRLAELNFALFQKGYSKTQFISGEEELSEALAAATLILIATPVMSDLDLKVISGANQNAKILHLGAQSHEINHFKSSGIEVLSLSDLFAMEKEQNIFRDKQIKQAMEACRSRALLRSMARSISIPHGWEDLALFY